MGTYTKEAIADLSNRRSGPRTDSGEPRKSYLTLPDQRLFRRRRAVRYPAFAKRTNHTVSRNQGIAAQSERGCSSWEPQAYRRSGSGSREGGEGEGFFSRGNFSQRLVKTSADNLKRTYESEGFSSVTVTPEVNRSGGNISVQFRVDEGPQDVVASLHVVGNNTVPVSILVPAGLKVTEGQPYSTKKVNEDRNQIGAQYLRLGYLNATFRSNARPLGKNSHQLDVTYTIAEGPKVLLDSVMNSWRQSD